MLFGHQDNTAGQIQPGTPAPVVGGDHSMQQPVDQSVGVNPLAADSATGISLPVVSPDAPGPVDTPTADAPDEPAEQSILNQPSAPSLANAPTVTEDASALPDPGTPFSASPIVANVNTTEAQEAAVIASELDATPEEAQVPALAQDTYPAAHPEPVQHTDSNSYTAAPVAVDAVTPASNPAASQTDDLLQLKQQAITQLSPLISHLDQSSEEKFRTTMMLIQSTDNSALLKDAYDAARAIADDGARAQALLDVVNEINYFTQQHDAQGK